jgi:DNA-binding IscR family transcriptional regulator
MTLLRYMHIDADALRRVIDTLIQSELVEAVQLQKGGYRYSLL